MRNLNYVYNTQWIGVRAPSSLSITLTVGLNLRYFRFSTSSSRFNDMLTCIILISWLLILWIYFLWSRRRYYAAAWKLRGPVGWPFIGMGLQMMNPQSNPPYSRKSCYVYCSIMWFFASAFLQYMDNLSHQYKAPFISWMGTNCFLYVNDPQSVEQIFNSTHCTNKGDFYRFMSSAIGDGLFTSSCKSCISTTVWIDL